MQANIRNMVITSIILGIFLNACTSKTPKFGHEVSVNGGKYYEVNVQELQAMLEDKDFVMINVHIPWQGNIPQTDLHLAFDQIEANQAQLPAERDIQILVYCLTSGMAKTAVQSLVDLGYTNVWMLEGGTIAWEEAGLSLNNE